MKSSDVKKLMKDVSLDTNAEADRRVFSSIVKAFEKSKSGEAPRYEPHIWRIIMKSKITRIAAAAVVIVAALIGINQFGGSVNIAGIAWADAIGAILNAHTVSFDASLKVGEQPEQQSHFDCLIPDRFVQTMSDGTINIVDYSQQKVLILDTNNQIAEVRNLQHGFSERALYNIFIEMQDLIRQTVDMNDARVAMLGNGNINGRDAIGFQVQLIGTGIIPGWYGKGDFIVWAQPETGQPLQLEWHSHMTGLAITVNNLAIDEITDKTAFSFEIPEGYELKPTDNEEDESPAPNAGLAEQTQDELANDIFDKQIEIPRELLSTPASDEQKIVNFLWSWTLLNNGLFPSSLSTDALKDIDPNAVVSFKQKGWGFESALSINLSNLFDGLFAYCIDRELTEEEIEQLKRKEGPVYEKLQTELANKMEEIKPLVTAIGNGFSVVFQMTAESDWHYAGTNVQLGDANTPVFWYRPKGSEVYRVIYGDLRVEEVASEDIPK